MARPLATSGIYRVLDSVAIACRGTARPPLHATRRAGLASQSHRVALAPKKGAPTAAAAPHGLRIGLAVPAHGLTALRWSSSAAAGPAPAASQASEAAPVDAIAAAVARADEQRTARLLGAAVGSGALKASAEAFSVLSRAAAYAGNADAAEAVLRFAIDADVRLTAEVTEPLLDLCATRRDWERAVRVCVAVSAAGESAAPQLIRSASHYGAAEAVKEALHALVGAVRDEAASPPSGEHRPAVATLIDGMRACPPGSDHSGDVKAAFAALVEVAETDEAVGGAYDALVVALLRAAKLDDAFSAWKKACAEGFMLRAARTRLLHDLLDAAGDEASRRSRSGGANAAHARRLEQAWAVFEAMAEDGDVRPAGSRRMIVRLMQARRTDQMLAAFRLLAPAAADMSPWKKSPLQTEQHLNPVIVSLLSSGNVDGAFEVLDWMCDGGDGSYHSDSRPNTRTFNYFLDWWLRERKGAAASTELTSLGELMRAHDVQPDNATISIVLKYRSSLDASSNVTDADRDALGVLAGVLGPSATRDHPWQSMSVDETLARAVEAVGVLPGDEETLDASTFNVVIDSHVRSARMDLAVAAAENMRAVGIAPDIVTYRTLFKGAWRLVGPKQDDADRGALDGILEVADAVDATEEELAKATRDATMRALRDSDPKIAAALFGWAYEAGLYGRYFAVSERANELLPEAYVIDLRAVMKPEVTLFITYLFRTLQRVANAGGEEAPLGGRDLHLMTGHQELGQLGPHVRTVLSRNGVRVDGGTFRTVLVKNDSLRAWLAR